MLFEDSWSGFLKSVSWDAEATRNNIRLIPFVVPEGDIEVILTEQLLKRFQGEGFRILDITSCTPVEAIEALSPPWPRLNDKDPKIDQIFSSPPGWDRLVIRGGRPYEKFFWEDRGDAKLLYGGRTSPANYSSIGYWVP